MGGAVWERPHLPMLHTGEDLLLLLYGSFRSRHLGGGGVSYARKITLLFVLPEMHGTDPQERGDSHSITE